MINLEDEALFKAATGFGGGIGREGFVCGALASAVMALGMVHGRKDLGDREGLERTYSLASELYRWFQSEFGNTTCKDITGYLLKNPEELKAFRNSEAHDRCVEMVGKTALWVQEALSRE